MEQQTTQVLVVDDNPEIRDIIMFYWKGRYPGDRGCRWQFSPSFSGKRQF